jgi:hypothetical protein
MAFSHQQSSMGSRAPSVLRQHRPMSPDNASEYSFDHRTTRFKDSGFNSTHGNGTLNSQASNHSSSVGQKTPPPSIAQTPSSPTLSYYPDEEDEDLIDPVHNALENHEQRYLSQKHSQEEQDTTQRQREYIDWINMNVRRRKINTLSDLRTGETLLELLESLSNKEIRKPINNPGQSIHTQIMDRTILAFQFMGSEGIELDGSFSVKGNFYFILFVYIF